MITEQPFFSQVSNVIVGTLSSYWHTLKEVFPLILSAITLVILGLVLARLGYEISVRVVRSLNIKKIPKTKVVEGSLEKKGIKVDYPKIIGSAVYWLIFLVFAGAAASALGLSVLADNINSLVSFVPRIIAVIIVIAFTLVAGEIVKDLVEGSLEQINFAYRSILGTIAELVIIMFGIPLAVAQLGLDISILSTNLTIIIGGAVVALGLAFVIGSKETISNLTAGFYLSKIIKKDSVLTIAGKKGTIKKLTPIAVILETEDGEQVIPNSKIINN